MATYFGKEYTNIGTESNPVWQAAGGGSAGGGGGAGLESEVYHPATTSPRKGARVKGLLYAQHIDLRGPTNYGIAHHKCITTPHEGWTISVPEGHEDYPVQHTCFVDIDPATGIADPGSPYTSGTVNANGTNSIICGNNATYNHSGYFLSYGKRIQAMGDIPGSAYFFNITAKASFNVQPSMESVFSGVLSSQPFNNTSGGWQTIDLSPYIGARRCLVRLFVGLDGAREGTWTDNNVGDTYVQFRTPGDTLTAYPGEMHTGGGCCHVLVGNGTDDAFMWGGYVLVLTDENGKIEAIQGKNTSNTSIDIGFWTSGFAPVSGVSDTILNGPLGTSNTYSSTLNYLGQNIGGGGGTDGSMKFAKLSTNYPNSLIYMRATSTSSGEYLYARTPNDPINWYNDFNHSKCGMSGIYTRSTNAQGGYIAAFTDENGDIEVQGSTNTHARLDIVAALGASAVY